MYSLSRLGWATFAVVLIGGVAYGQSGDTRSARGWAAAGRGSGVAAVRLASLEAVQQELNLTSDQRLKVTEINDRLHADRRDLFRRGDGDFRALRSAMEKLHRQAVADLQNVLDDEQQKRLAGLSIQVNEGAALLDPLVAEALRLSEEQKTQLAETGHSVRREMADTFRRSREADLPRERFREKFSQLREESSAEFLAVLTAEQQQRFESLRGEPVEIDLARLGRGGGAARFDRPSRPEGDRGE